MSESPNDLQCLSFAMAHADSVQWGEVRVEKEDVRLSWRMQIVYNGEKCELKKEDVLTVSSISTIVS